MPRSVEYTGSGVEDGGLPAGEGIIGGLEAQTAGDAEVAGHGTPEDYGA